MAGEVITITCNPDGTYTVASTEEQGEPAQGDQPLNQAVKSVDEVLSLVRQELGDDAGAEGPQQAWDAEAQGRDSSGFRQPGAGPAMSM